MRLNDHHHRYYNYEGGASGPYNPCPMAYTVQGGVCKPTIMVRGTITDTTVEHLGGRLNRASFFFADSRTRNLSRDLG
jgi:phage baseplate assembly protein gpV